MDILSMRFQLPLKIKSDLFLDAHIYNLGTIASDAFCVGPIC
jgi:hypothetical protein